MTSMVANGSVNSSSSSQLSPSVMVQEKGTRNKRKFRADPPSGHGQSRACDMYSVNQDQSDGLKLELGLSSNVGSSGVGVTQTRVELDADELPELDIGGLTDWSDLTETQLEGLVLSNLDMIFTSAIKKIVACGYTEEVATKAVLRSSLYYGSKDTVSNIVDNTLAFLRNGQELDPSREHYFEDLQQLERYILAELVCVLREVRPFFSTGDAMWCLLICDMNISHACAMDSDPLNSFIGDGTQNGTSSVSSQPHPKTEANSTEPKFSNPSKPIPATPCFDTQPIPATPCSHTKPLSAAPCSHSSQPDPRSMTEVSKTTKQKNLLSHGGLITEKEGGNSASHMSQKSFSVTGTGQSSPLEEKFVYSKKITSGCTKREYILRQKSIHLEKSYRTYACKGTRAAKLGSLGGLTLDRKLKSVSDATVSLKTASLKITTSVGVDADNHRTDNHLRNAEPSSAAYNLETGTTVSAQPKSFTQSAKPAAIQSAAPKRVIQSAVPKSVIQSALPKSDIQSALPKSDMQSALPKSNAQPAVPKSDMQSALLDINGAIPLPAASTPPLVPADTELSLSLATKNNIPSTCACCNGPNCGLARMARDKTLGQLIPQDKKDEMILKLFSRVREMQNMIQEWNDWANQKVMQATRRLVKDKGELKTLRQEKEEVERLNKEKQTLEENTMKKLSEMENALSKASGQVERANSAVRRLEVENAALRLEMEAAKLSAAESAASCQEVSKREKNTLTKFQSWEKQKTMFQEELIAEKRKAAELLQELKQAKALEEQFVDIWKQEEKGKEDLLAQASSIRKEREQIEVSMKSKEDLIKMKAENNLRRYKNDIQTLEKEISLLRLKTDSSKIAALRRGIDGSDSSKLAGTGSPAPKDSPIAYISEVLSDFHDYSKAGVKRERECVMCLSEEISVVFLPCAHQVVCAPCNELHEKQGMKECPSCRSLIQRRIPVCYAPS